MAQKILPNYVERAGKMATKARKLACRQAAAHWREASKAAADIGSLEIECINQMRAAGEKILEACGRTQLVFNLDVKEFVRKKLLPHLPPGMELPQVQACVQIAAHVKEPIKTRDELKSVKAEMQLAFQALGLLEPPRRGEQSRIERNVFCEFVTKARNVEIVIESLEKDLPLEKWDPPALDEFLETLVPIVGLYERAKKIRLGIPASQ